MVGRGSFERAFERIEHVGGGLLDVLWTVPSAARWNRMPVASVVVLVLAGLAGVVAGGGLGVPAAARAIPATVQSGPGAPGLNGELPSASGSPVASVGPGDQEPATNEPGLSFEPVASGAGDGPPGASGGDGLPAGSGGVEP
jgi:hypothetical protein